MLGKIYLQMAGQRLQLQGYFVVSANGNLAGFAQHKFCDGWQIAADGAIASVAFVQQLNGIVAGAQVQSGAGKSYGNGAAGNWGKQQLAVGIQRQIFIDSGFQSAGE